MVVVGTNQQVKLTYHMLNFNLIYEYNFILKSNEHWFEKINSSYHINVSYILLL